MIELQGGLRKTSIFMASLASALPPPHTSLSLLPLLLLLQYEKREMKAVMFYVIVQGGNVVFCNDMTPKWYCMFI